MAKKKSTKKKKRPVCGDFGGVRKDGKPCGVQVGNKKCRHHTDDANERREQVKKRLARLYSQGTYSLTAVCKDAGIAPVTLWRWRQEDPNFEKAFDDAQLPADWIRGLMVEDNLFRRLVEGDASPVEVIFYLTNRLRGRWKHRKALELTGPEDGPVQFEEIDPSKLTDDEIHYLKDLAQKVAKREVREGN